MRTDDELTKRIYEAQKENPVKGDWIELLKEDFKFIGEEINEKHIKEFSKAQYKNYQRKG